MTDAKATPTPEPAAPAKPVVEAELLPLEVEISQESQLMALAERSFLASLEKHGDDAKKFLERRAELMATARVLALRATRPEDWILTRDKQGTEIGMLAGPGADQVANLYGIQILNVRPFDDRGVFQPERIPDPKNGDRFTLRAWCDCFSGVTGRAIQGLEASRRSDEDFTGRQVDAKGDIVFSRGVGAMESDLRAGVQTLLRTKAVRVLAGMTRVPVSELRAAGLDIERCRKGHGFGSSDERKAQKGVDKATAGSAEELWNEILRRTGGDDDAAHQVLREITAYPAAPDGRYKAFDGCNSWQQLNTQKRVDRAAEKLAKHPQFGDHAGGDDDGREPGED